MHSYGNKPVISSYLNMASNNKRGKPGWSPFETEDTTTRHYQTDRSVYRVRPGLKMCCYNFLDKIVPPLVKYVCPKLGPVTEQCVHYL